MDVLTYSPGKVVLSISGYVVEGWTSISFSFNTPMFRQVRGIRGRNTRLRIKDTSATVKIALMQTSVSNDVLRDVVVQNRYKGVGRLELTLKDNSGTTLLASQNAYIEGIPEVSFTASQVDRAWTILCDDVVDTTLGGNAEQGVDFGSMIGSVVSKLF